MTPRTRALRGAPFCPWTAADAHLCSQSHQETAPRRGGAGVQRVSHGPEFTSAFAFVLQLITAGEVFNEWRGGPALQAYCDQNGLCMNSSIYRKQFSPMRVAEENTNRSWHLSALSSKAIIQRTGSDAVYACALLVITVSAFFFSSFLIHTPKPNEVTSKRRR